MKALAWAALVAALSGADARAAAPNGDDPVVIAAQELDAQAGAHRLLLLGEMHGTREPPRLVAQLAGRYAQQGSVLVVLELSASIQARLDAYLDSDGSAQARAQLLSDPYWHRRKEESDGRRNLEVIDLVERLRQLRKQGHAVAMLAMDNRVGEDMSSADRDQAMAARIRTAHAALPAAGRMLVVTGNVHAMKALPLFAPPEMQKPMGSYLLDLQPFAVDLVAGGGAFWACIERVCGERAIPERPMASGPDASGAYDYRLVLPRYTVARMIPE